ncbi:Putative protein [Zobellia galactanivorans]|uniref:Uncharacterized protein n=1 Tax=Zobellia galactanivorans (strain DSM 12802 / CCUG 47099 / CIP 106680 / NCIMB 13871 / Dsij) TaxID=63186 RepID=G0L3G0_ZOBGA|nr:Putative protein [Zobellia galactanivorans]
MNSWGLLIIKYLISGGCVKEVEGYRTVTYNWPLSEGGLKVK